MTTTRSPRHEANIIAKAERAIEAIESLATWRLIDGVDFPNIANRREALAYLLGALDGSYSDHEAAAWWVVVGVEHDRLAGKVAYRPGELPTHFDTSRDTVVALLAAVIHGIDNPPPADPFEGLAF